MSKFLKIQYRNTFEKDVKRSKKPGFDLEKLKVVIRLLAEEAQLPLDALTYCAPRHQS
jgi:mRNA-degrading endonuclease YafQ of YafQ-DinJ toxin-antitoxin module